jgi:hypothetical protein
MLPHVEGEARKRQCHGLTAPGRTLVEKIPRAKSRDEAGQLLSVNGRYVSAAKAIKEKDVEMFEQIRRARRRFLRQNVRSGEKRSARRFKLRQVRLMQLGKERVRPCATSGVARAPSYSHQGSNRTSFSLIHHME